MPKFLFSISYLFLSFLQGRIFIPQKNFSYLYIFIANNNKKYFYKKKNIYLKRNFKY